MYLKPIETIRHPRLGRLLRAGLGLGLLALFGYSLLPGVIYTQYPLGRVNAGLVTVRAPIDGQVAFRDLRVGQRVSQGQALARLSDPPERDVRLANLWAQEHSLADRITSLERQMAGLEPLMERLGRDSDNFRAAVISSLTAQTGEAEAQVKRAEANLRLLETQLKRTESLAGSSYASKADLDRRRADADVAKSDLAARRKALDRLLEERRAAHRGVYLSDSYNNAPYSQQRRDEIELQRLSLINRHAEIVAERAQVRRQIEAEQSRRDLVGNAAIAAPLHGVLWRVLEGDNITVGAGTALLQVADCTRLYFEVAQDRRGEETLSMGDTLTVEFENEGKTILRKAQLVSLRSEHDEARRELALNSPLAADQLRWIFALEPDMGDSESCPIGRVGRLHYSNTLIDRIARRTGFPLSKP